MKKWLKEDNIKLDLKAKDKDAILNELNELALESKKISDPEEFTRAIFDREAKITTGIGSGIAIPHARSNAVKDFVMVFARSKKGLNFKALDDKPVHLFFLLGAPFDHDEEYLEAMGRLSKLLKEPTFRSRLLEVKTKAEILDTITGG
ncbi:MAG: PTS sugar transporter subunit IIA [Candidatus Wallbacteria bacterium]|nr:PTS sugar transporter subunit IIA [Candidatus Wallbacteria bacterium]